MCTPDSVSVQIVLHHTKMLLHNIHHVVAAGQEEHFCMQYGTCILAFLSLSLEAEHRTYLQIRANSVEGILMVAAYSVSGMPSLH